jgi:hypothetical protein
METIFFFWKSFQQTQLSFEVKLAETAFRGPGKLAEKVWFRNIMIERN